MRVVRRLRLLRPLALASAVLSASWILAACGGSSQSSSASPSASASSPASSASLGPARVETSEGPVHLVVELPKLVVKAGDDLAGTATIFVQGIDDLEIMASGMGPLMFQLQRLDGLVEGGVPVTADLRQQHLLAATPLVEPIPPMANFSLWQHSVPPGADVEVHALTPGDWRLTVIAEYYEGPGVNAALHRHLMVEQMIRVEP